MVRDAASVAGLLHEIGQRIALGSGNPYRARAYSNAASTLRSLAEPLEQVIAAGRLPQLPGIGDAIAAVIPILQDTGTHPTLEALRADVPPGVLELLTIPGLKPEKVLALFRDLGIASLDQLRAAAESGALAGAKRFGPAFQQKVLQGLAARQQGKGRLHMHRAAEILETEAHRLKALLPGIKEVTVAGDLRRGCELVGDLALVATVKDGATVAAAGDITLHLTDPERRGMALLLATGSQAHVAQLRSLAQGKGWTLDARGLCTRESVIAKTERAIYAALGMQFVDPELREGEGEVAAALAGALPKLVAAKDLRGILHAHTTRSDGADTLQDMADAARARGYAYLGISDHSQSAHYAGGLKLPEIAAQHAEIDRLNAGYGHGFRLLKGIEADILEDGSLDYPDEVLARFDFVVASVHGRFRLDETRQTARILRAVANPFTTILGHMTGRQLLRRPGYELDIEAVLQACARHGVAVEVNANPWRLDLDWRWHRRALALGCTLSINPDAHSVTEIDLVRWGVAVARKGGVPKSHVLNTLELPKLQRLLLRRRVRAGAA